MLSIEQFLLVTCQRCGTVAGLSTLVPDFVKHCLLILGCPCPIGVVRIYDCGGSWYLSCQCFKLAQNFSIFRLRVLDPIVPLWLRPCVSVYLSAFRTLGTILRAGLYYDIFF